MRLCKYERPHQESGCLNSCILRDRYIILLATLDGPMQPLLPSHPITPTLQGRILNRPSLPDHGKHHCCEGRLRCGAALMCLALYASCAKRQSKRPRSCCRAFSRPAHLPRMLLESRAEQAHTFPSCHLGKDCTVSPRNLCSWYSAEAAAIHRFRP